MKVVALQENVENLFVRETDPLYSSHYRDMTEITQIREMDPLYSCHYRDKNEITHVCETDPIYSNVNDK